MSATASAHQATVVVSDEQRRKLIELRQKALAASPAIPALPAPQTQLQPSVIPDSLRVEACAAMQAITDLILHYLDSWRAVKDNPPAKQPM